MPTHIMAVPTYGLTEVPIVHTNPKLFAPFRGNEGQEKLRAYHAMCDAWNEMQNPDPTTRLWKVNKILKVSNKEVKDGKRSIFYKAQFNDGNKACVPMDVLRVDEPFLMINHAYTNGYTEDKSMEWIRDYLDTESEMEQLLRTYNMTTESGKKFKFRIEVPKTQCQAIDIDRRNGNDG